MKFKNYFWVVSLSLVILISSVGEAANTGKMPEAFSFNAPTGPNVDSYTGDLSFSLPLLNVQSTGGFNVPISLSYAAGIGVEQEGSWVGLGLFLSGGAITRDVNGIPDDYFSEKNKGNRVIAGTGNVVKEVLNWFGIGDKVTGNPVKGSSLAYDESDLKEIELDDKASLKRLKEQSNFRAMHLDAQDKVAKIGFEGDSGAWDFGGADIGYSGISGQHISGFDDGFFYTIGCRTNSPLKVDCASPDSYKVSAPGLNGELIIVGEERAINSKNSKKRFAFKNPSGRIVKGRDDPMKVEAIIVDYDFEGFKIIDKSGNEYYFDEPLYYTNEDGRDAKNGGGVCNEDHVYQRIIAGEKQPNKMNCDMLKQKFAYTWLLSMIVDAEGNKIEFKYDKYDKPFRFRNPFGPGYNSQIPSLKYNDGPSSEGYDAGDGSLTAMDGWMELAYLEKIETPVYEARFITSNRLDSVEYDDKFEYPNEFISQNKDKNIPISSFIGEGRKKKLDKIEVYSKISGKAKHVMSYRFVYDYSLQQGIPDTISKEEGNKGKLTLKELWVLGQNDKLPENAPLPYRFEYGNNAKPGEPGNPNYVTGAGILEANNFGLLGEDFDNAMKASGIKWREGKFWEDMIRGMEYSDYHTDYWGYYWEDGNSRNHRIEDRWFDGSYGLVYFEKNSKPIMIKQNNIEGVKAWSLTKINYPTQSSTSIEYEMDRYAFVGKQPTTLEVGDGDVWLGLGVEMTPKGVTIANVEDDNEDCYGNKFDRSQASTPFPLEVEYFYPGKKKPQYPYSREDYYVALSAFLDMMKYDKERLPGYFENHYIENLPDSIAESNRMLHYGGGLRVKQITHNDGVRDYITKYHYVNSISDARTGKDDAFTSSGVSSRPTFELRQRIPFVIGYRKVIEELPNNAYVAHEYSSPYEYPVKKVENYNCYSKDTEYTMTRLQDPAYFWDFRDLFQDTSYMWGQEVKTEQYSSTGEKIAEVNTEYNYEPQNGLLWEIIHPTRPELRIESLLPYYTTPAKRTIMQDNVATTKEISFADNGLPESEITASELGENARVSKTEYSKDKTLIQRHIIDKPVKNLIGNRGKWFNEVNMRYDNDGKLLETKRVDLDGKGRDEFTKYEYDKYGNVEAITYPEGNKEEVRYKKGYLPEKGWDSREWSSENKPLWKNEYDEIGRIIGIKDSNGNFVKYGYDELSRVHKVVKPGDDENNPGVVYGYVADKIPAARKTSVKMNPSQFNIAIEYYDGGGKLLQKQQSKDDNLFMISKVEYNEMGEPEFFYKPVEAISYGDYVDQKQYYNMFPNADYMTMEYYRDPLMRAYKVHPYGDKNVFIENVYSNELNDDGYEYQTAIIIDENGNEVLTKRDHFGDVIELKEPDLQTGKITENSHITKNKYDALGRLIVQEDALGHVSSNEYNSLNRLEKSYHPDAGVNEMKYDLNGNLIEKKTPKGIIKYKYDNANRLVKVEYPDGSGYEYYYDLSIENSLTNCENGKDKLCGVKGEYGKTSYDYDERGRIKRIIHEISGKKYNIEYQYDSADNIIAVKNPAGITTLYNFDNAGRLQNLAMDSNGDGVADKGIAGYTYNPTNTVNTIQFGNNIITRYGYTVRDWLESINTYGTNNILNRKYDFDRTGNIISMSDNNGRLADYGYDRLYRLTNVNDNNYYGGNIEYGYDAVGNRQRMVDKNGVYEYNYEYETGGDSIKLMSVSGAKTISFGYDESGNMIRKNDKLFVYGAENRMNCFGDYVYVYDVSGDRVKKIHFYDKDKALVDVYVYDAAGNLIFEETKKADFDDWKSLLRCSG